MLTQHAAHRDMIQPLIASICWAKGSGYTQNVLFGYGHHYRVYSLQLEHVVYYKLNFQTFIVE